MNQSAGKESSVKERGVRYAVCGKTFNLYRRSPYAEFFEFVEPVATIPLEEAQPFECSGMRVRHPREAKGMNYDATTAGERGTMLPGKRDDYPGIEI